MADIRIRALPDASPAVPTDFVAIDNGTTRKVAISDLVDVGRPLASQAEAEAGTDPAKAMTPLTTKQAVTAYGLTKDGNLSGLTNTTAAQGNLGLGSAAVASASDFATAAQGLLANSAMQPSDYDPSAIGGNVFDRGRHVGFVATGVSSKTIPSAVQSFRTDGYADATDLGGAVYSSVPSQPTDHNAWVQDAGGRYFINVEPKLDIRQFGVFGSDDPNALVDETTGIANAIKAAIALKRELYIPGAHYQTDRFQHLAPHETYLQGEASSRPVFHALQSVANATGGAGRLFQFLGGGSSYTDNEVGAFTLAADVNPFQQKITLNSVTGIEAGMMIQIASNQAWYYDDRGTYFRGEIHLIQKVLTGTNQVQIDDYTRDRYLPGSQTITVRVWRPDRFVMNNIAIEYPDPADNTANTRALVLDRCMKPEFNDCLIKGSTGSGILNSRSWLGRYSNLEIQDTGLALSDTLSIGYGVHEASVYGTIFTGTKSRACRRTVDFDSLTAQTLAAPSRDCIFRDFHITGSGIDGTGQEFFPGGVAPNYGVGGHGPVENLIITSGYISDVEQGVNIRSRNTEISNVHFAGEMNYCFYGTYGTGVELHNCRYMRDDFPNKVSAAEAESATYYNQLPIAFARFGISSGVGDWNYNSPVKITDNVAHGLQRAFVEFGVSGAGPKEIENVIAHGNTALLRIPTGSTFNFFNVDGGGDARFGRSKLGPNKQINRGAGSTEMFMSGMNFGNVSQMGIDAAVEIADNEYMVTITDDNVAVIRDASRYNNDRVVILMSDQSGNTYGSFILPNASATTISLGAISATIAATATGSSLTGTTGTDGNFTVGLTAGDLYMENRTGASRRIRIRVM